MVVLTIFVSVIAGTIILSGSISHGMREIKKELSGIKDGIRELNVHLCDIAKEKSHKGAVYVDLLMQINSLRKILARNFRIAFNDKEFENL